MRTGWVVQIGRITYSEGCDLQNRIVAARKLNRVPDVLLLCEHPHVITLGRNGKREHLLASEPVLRQMGVEFHETNRGGDITYHGPGQLVAYPIFDLNEIRRDLAWYVRQLEEAMIRASAEYGVKAERRAGHRGVWVNVASGGEEKLGAIGVHVSRWVTSHGLAYNVATDLRYFDLIVPCGIQDKRATSLERLRGERIDSEQVAAALVKHLGDCFDVDLRPMQVEDLRHALAGAEVPELAATR